MEPLPCEQLGVSEAERVDDLFAAGCALAALLKNSAVNRGALRIGRCDTCQLTTVSNAGGIELNRTGGDLVQSIPAAELWPE